MNNSLAAADSRPLRPRDNYMAGDEFQTPDHGSGKPQFVKDAEIQQKIDIAVSRERERCAKVAESCIPANEDAGEFLRCSAMAAREIAYKIRNNEIIRRYTIRSGK